ncbi:MAG: tautomerase family protein [Pseudonocardia sp.]|nr:tautomerase family protein [Pseudonocardia sp.]
MEVHLVEGRHPPAQLAELLTALSERYAEVLGAPLDRVRAYLTLHRPEHWATAGRPGVEAPYVTAVVLEGRPVEQRHRLLAAFTDVVVEVLGVERGLVRGRLIAVHPDDWGIAGVPASVARVAEIAARSVP